MVSDRPQTHLAYRCSVPTLRQCESSHVRPRLARVGVIRLDEVFKYLSRHRINYMTGYGKCCGRLIVAQNWLHCPFCGGDLLGGFPITLRSRIEDAEQTGMDDFLTGLDEASNPSRPSMNLSMKKLRLIATTIQLTGRSKMTKPELLAAILAKQDQGALFDF